MTNDQESELLPVTQELLDEIADAIRPIHWETWKAALFSDQEEWPDDDEQEIIERGVDDIAVLEHWDAWGKDIVAKVAQIAARHRLAHSPDAASSRVAEGWKGAKPLYWRKATDHPQDAGQWVADGISGRYSAEKQRDGTWLLWWAHDNFIWEACKDFAEVKAKAEKDWQTRYASLAGPAGACSKEAGGWLGLHLQTAVQDATTAVPEAPPPSDARADDEVTSVPSWLIEVFSRNRSHYEALPKAIKDARLSHIAALSKDAS